MAKYPKVDKRHVSQAVSMISKITDAMFKNIEKYKAAKAAGKVKEVEAYKKVAMQLQATKRNWAAHLDELLLDLEKDVELELKENTTMKKLDLKRLILEEARNLLNEKFGSPKFQLLKNKLSKYGGEGSFFANTAKKFGIQWDLVGDDAIGYAANPAQNVVNFMFVNNQLKGAFIGKNFIDAFASALDKANRSKAIGSRTDANYDVYYKNYKRVLADADEIITIDLNVAKQKTSNIIADRAMAKHGALALQKARDIARNNSFRYQELLKAKRDINGFGQDEVEKLVGECGRMLEQAIASHVSQLKAGMLPQESWNTHYEEASRLHKDVLDLYKRYLDAGQKEANAIKAGASGVESEEETNWYIDWAVKDAKSHVSDIRTKMKEYALKVQKIQKMPLRYIGEYPN
jgi:hypothetical protein